MKERAGLLRSKFTGLIFTTEGCQHVGRRVNSANVEKYRPNALSNICGELELRYSHDR
jgi:hypothetical protein